MARRSAAGWVALAVVAACNGSHHHSPTPPTTTSTSPPTTLAKPSVAAENIRSGTLGWTVQHPSTAGQIEGYADRVSALQGDMVTLFVTSTAPQWTASAYRMGWYGGALARLVWQSGPEPGVQQPAPTRDHLNMIDTKWSPSLSVTITPDWPPGDYLFKLVSSTGWDSYVPLTVRDDSSRAAILVVNSVTTWQAYNLWGGYDLYSGLGPAGSQTGADRADEVSFDRPYRLGDGSGDFLGNEEKLVKLVEKEGLDVTYATDIDIAQRPQLLASHRVVVSLGHDEYYSLAMRDGLEAARERGVNLLFLGANAAYRHIRLDASPLGTDRREINYRVATSDPVDGVDDADVTVQWREPPNNRPESSLLGEEYQCNPVLADMVVSDPLAWVFVDTGLHAGEHLPGLVGSEYDHYSSADPQPAGQGVELMAQSPVRCRGVASTSDFTYYVAPSGAGVVDVGTNLWVPNVLDEPRVGNTVATITLTMLRQASRGPLGQLHPVRRTAISGPQGNAPSGE